MRDFRDAKAMAQTLRATLAARGLKITISESLELIAKAFGASDWNTLSAAIKAAAAEPPAATVPPSSIPRPARRVSFSAALEATLARAVGLAAARKDQLTTLEHLLLSLIDDIDAAAVMRACRVDLARLKQSLTSHIDAEPGAGAAFDGEDPAPTAGFQRVIQRAVVHVQTAGRDEVTGANVLVAIFSERESHAAYFLREQNMSRFDAVNFIAHGIRTDGGRAA
jgi:hypothetical protein